MWEKKIVDNLKKIAVAYTCRRDARRNEASVASARIFLSSTFEIARFARSTGGVRSEVGDRGRGRGRGTRRVRAKRVTVHRACVPVCLCARFRLSPADEPK